MPRAIPPTPLSCHHCGYDLAGLPESARCPECAVPVRESILRRSTALSPRYLRSLQIGAALILLSLVCIGGLAALILARGLGIRTILNPIPVLLAACTGMVAWPAGWWVLASPPPVWSPIEQEDCRFGLHALTIATAFPMLMVIAVLLIGGGTGIVPCAGLLLAVLIPATWLTGFGYIASLARHDLDAPNLRRAAIAANLALPVAIIVGLTTLSAGMLAAMCGLCALGAVVLITLIHRAERARNHIPAG